MAEDDVQANSVPAVIPAQQTSKIVSRGVPAKESLWLDDVRKRREEWQYHKKVRLELYHLIQIVFPKQHQPKYHDVALKFMNFLLEKGRLEGADTGSFITTNGFSKATFYNVILPRLKKVGMVRLLREEFNQSKDKQKYYRKIIEPSKQFSLFFRKLGDEYETILDTAEAKRPKQEEKLPDKL
jgi:hypothetical protein